MPTTRGPVLSDCVARPAKLHARRTALVDGDVTMTYRELDDRCRRLATGLHARGAGTGTAVATLLANGSQYLECYLGVPGAGCVLVPLNQRLAAPELRFILEDADVRLLLTDAAHLELARAAADGTHAEILTTEDYEALLAAAHADPWSRFAVAEDDLATLFYTGGTTGRAKGVMLSHRNLMANVASVLVALGYDCEDTYLHAAPMFHLGDGLSTHAVTAQGGCHAFVPSFDAGAVLACIERDRVTASLWVPAMLTMLLDHPSLRDCDLGSLRLVLHGAAPIAPELLTASIEAFGCSFSQLYGMTEAAPVLTVLPHEERRLGDPRLASAGREVLGVDVTVRRPDGERCAPGEVGEVVARGANIMQGYLNLPEATAEVLRDGWYWTGDVAHADADGYLYIIDRAKDMIISGGENVYSVEVENAVMAHPAVLEAAVIGVPDERWGERVHAVVALREAATLEPAELREDCKRRIAGYKAPRSVEIVDALPRSAAGKVLKGELRARHWDGRERGVA